MPLGSSTWRAGSRVQLVCSGETTVGGAALTHQARKKWHRFPRCTHARRAEGTEPDAVNATRACVPHRTLTASASGLRPGFDCSPP